MLAADAFKPTELVWLDASTAKGEYGEEVEDDMTFVEEYFRVAAEFLALWRKKKAGSWAETVKYYESGMKKSFVQMHSKIMETELFKDIANSTLQDYPQEYAQIIVPLLDQDDEDSAGNQAKVNEALQRFE